MPLVEQIPQNAPTDDKGRPIVGPNPHNPGKGTPLPESTWKTPRQLEFEKILTNRPGRK